jgi:rare lipoprotein A
MRFILSALTLAFSISYASADEFGIATYYHNPRYRGLIAAHPKLAFGTHVRVHDLDNGRFARGRIIDLSTSAADVLGIRRAGIARVRLELL